MCGKNINSRSYFYVLLHIRCKKPILEFTTRYSSAATSKYGNGSFHPALYAKNEIRLNSLLPEKTNTSKKLNLRLLKLTLYRYNRYPFLLLKPLRTCCLNV
jgi:hypothetical protein